MADENKNRLDSAPTAVNVLVNSPRALGGSCELNCVPDFPVSFHDERVVMQKFLSLRVEAFHNSIALTDHVVVSVAIIGRRNNFNKFSGWPGPGWSSPGISISLKHLDRHIFL